MLSSKLVSHYAALFQQYIHRRQEVKLGRAPIIASVAKAQHRNSQAHAGWSAFASIFLFATRGYPCLETVKTSRFKMRDIGNQVPAEISNMQADIGEVQRYLDICAQASARVYSIERTSGHVPSSPERESAASNDIPSMPTWDVLAESAEWFASISTRFENDVADIRIRLDSLLSQIIEANKAARHERCRTETSLLISCSSDRQNQERTNGFQAISTTEGSQHMIDSTSGDSISVRNLTSQS